MTRHSSHSLANRVDASLSVARHDLLESTRTLVDLEDLEDLKDRELRVQQDRVAAHLAVGRLPVTPPPNPEPVGPPPLSRQLEKRLTHRLAAACPRKAEHLARFTDRSKVRLCACGVSSGCPAGLGGGALDRSGLDVSAPSGPVFLPVLYASSQWRSVPRTMPRSSAMPRTVAPGVDSYKSTA